ncbi:unnamed protein product [Closterium sp. NIES-53]
MPRASRCPAPRCVMLPCPPARCAAIPPACHAALPPHALRCPAHPRIALPCPPAHCAALPTCRAALPARTSRCPPRPRVVLPSPPARRAALPARMSRCPASPRVTLPCPPTHRATLSAHASCCSARPRVALPCPPAHRAALPRRAALPASAPCCPRSLRTLLPRAPHMPCYPTRPVRSAAPRDLPLLPCAHCRCCCRQVLPPAATLGAAASGCIPRCRLCTLRHRGPFKHPLTPPKPAADAGKDLQWWYRADHLANTQWTERDTVAQLAIRAHLPVDQRAHFHQVTSAQTFYNIVVSHYSSLSPATRPLRQHRPLLGEVQQLVKEASVGTCVSARTGGAASGGGGFGGGQMWQQCQQETIPGVVEAASLGACEPADTDAAPVETLHTFKLDSGTTRCFVRDCTMVTTLTTHVPVTLSDPSRSPVIAHCSLVSGSPFW